MSQIPSKSSFKDVIESSILESLPEIIPPSSLKSKRAYTCTHHTNKPAYCLCAKCGKTICEKCQIVITGRRYCEACLRQDDNLRLAFEKEFFIQNLKAIESNNETWKAPQKISELPAAILNMMSDNYRFFKIAKDSSFGLTFLMAYIIFLPQVMYLIQSEAYKTLSKDEAYLQIIDSMSQEAIIALLLASPALQILLFDLIYFSAVRFFAKSDITFKQTSSVMHFCLLPLLFTPLALIFNMELISIICICLMIVLATTATRAATQCTLLQGMGIMLTFIFITNALHLF